MLVPARHSAGLGGALLYWMIYTAVDVDSTSAYFHSKHVEHVSCIRISKFVKAELRSLQFLPSLLLDPYVSCSICGGASCDFAMLASGFTNAPVSKTFLFGTIALSVLASITDSKYFFHINVVPHLWPYKQAWRILVWQVRPLPRALLQCGLTLNSFAIQIPPNCFLPA